MDERTSCCHGAGGYCDRCDLLVDLPGLHVIPTPGHVDGHQSLVVECADGSPIYTGVHGVAAGPGYVQTALENVMFGPLRVGGPAR